MTNSKFDQLEKAFFHDGYQLAINALKNTNNHTVPDAVIREMYAIIDGLIDSLFAYARQQNQAIECKKGCAWCCHQPVFALDYELNYLNNFIHKNFDIVTRSAIQKKAKFKREKLAQLEGDALLNAKTPCPLLHEGACLVYEARPMACRIYLSSDVKSCKQFFNNPDDKSNYPKLLDMPMRLGRMMNEGFKSALKTNGVEAKEYRIEEKLC
ncbi:YkgJ family cysteine cluster protein [uncultured Draconibacterium sp.]|uniref:YkgJ family cysteine cluster protein n=1 Tax=uncultured Draconibacterium sp. TaxID=1573823 RepID=UPI0025F97148|nr:YkgJ family cysteine cluster protein [uncultured Draconibacterium sp.]